MSILFEPDDYSMVVKNRAKPPAPWRWEIYRAGRNSPVTHSQEYFESPSMACLQGKAALKLLLQELQSGRRLQRALTSA